MSAPVEALFKKLNSVLRGWANYHRHVVSSEAFSRVDTYVFEQLWRMVRRRHQNKTKGWLIKKCWSASGKHVFSFVHKYKKKTRILKVIRICSIGIKRHIKIKAEANPYLPEYSNYFWRRRNVKEAHLLGALSHRQYQAMIVSRYKTVGLPHKGCLSKCLSCMMGNYHVQFLGGNRAAMPVTYPVHKKDVNSSIAKPIVY
ncbi:MAG: hypothetical protein MRK02_03560 [Candidatus Scalindua sp.]|nr:hypothetical protein [Candidatus Scalindua sp.]